MIAVNDATAALGTEPACRALGLSRATLYRGRRPAVVVRPRPAPPRTLALVERHGVLELLHTRFLDLDAQGRDALAMWATHRPGTENGGGLTPFVRHHVGPTARGDLS